MSASRKKDLSQTATVEELARRLSAETAERRRLEEALRSLPHQIISAQETERRRIAAELHDSINQILSSIKFRLQHVETKIVDHAVKECLTEARELLERAVSEVRRMSNNLRPSELDDFGLVAATERLIHEFEGRTNVRVEFKRGPLPRRFRPEVELAIYRILQEALGNVEEHSQAKNVTISLVADANFATLNIQDDGRGFKEAPKSDRRGRGLGLVHMRERAQALGGVFAIKSQPGRGTEISVHVKLS